MNYNKQDLIYAAGYIDGEGCITQCGKANSFGSFRLTISSTERIILEWFLIKFKGTINNQWLPKNPNHNMAWKWVLAGRQDLHQFLKAIEPYLKLKQGQVKLVVDYLDRYPYSYGPNDPPTKRGPNMTDQKRKDFLDTKIKLKQLKIDKHNR